MPQPVLDKVAPAILKIAALVGGADELAEVKLRLSESIQDRFRLTARVEILTSLSSLHAEHAWKYVPVPPDGSTPADVKLAVDCELAGAEAASKGMNGKAAALAKMKQLTSPRR